MTNVSATWLLPEILGWFENDERLLLLEGGTRSSKTWSVIQALIVTALDEECTIDVFRAEGTTCRRTVLKDFIEVMESMELYDASAHHKTDAIYTFPNGSEIRFAGADSSQKLRGNKRTHLYLNEANEFGNKAWKQLKIRTSGKVIMDWNPSFEVNQTFIADAKATSQHTKIRSTYTDNPFLSETQVSAIESLVPIYREEDGTEIEDPNLQYQGKGRLVKGSPTDWSIYGKAEYRRSPLLLLPHYDSSERFKIKEPTAYGLDFGFTAPSALVSVKIEETKPSYKNRAFAKEMLYEAALTTQQLVGRFKDLGISKQVPLYCDSAEPDRIQVLKQAGYNAKKAKKDLQAGLDTLRSHQLFVTGQNLVSEISSYQRKSPDSDVPASSPDHIIDATRYAVHTNVVEGGSSLSSAFSILNG